MLVLRQTILRLCRVSARVRLSAGRKNTLCTLYIEPKNVYSVRECRVGMAVYAALLASLNSDLTTMVVHALSLYVCSQRSSKFRVRVAAGVAHGTSRESVGPEARSRRCDPNERLRDPHTARTGCGLVSCHADVGSTTTLSL